MPRFRSVRPTQAGGHAWAETESGQYGLLAVDGSWALEPQFARVTPFEQGVAAVALDIGVRDVAGTLQRVHSFGLGRLDGSWVLEPVQGPRDPALLVEIRALSEGLAPAQDAGGRWGFLGADGGWRVPPRYDDAQPFSEGLAAVSEGGRWGYVLPDGSWAVAPAFRGAGPFSNGLGAVRVGRHGFTDAEWHTPFPGSFLRAEGYSEGLAAVKEEAGWGFVDTEERLVVPHGFWEVLEGGFREGHAVVAVGGERSGWGARARGWGLIDRGGEWVVAPSWADVAEPGVREGTVAVGVVGGGG